MTVTKVLTVQILQRRAILFFPTLRRDRQMAGQTQDTCDAGISPRDSAPSFSIRLKKGRGKDFNAAES